MLFSLSSVLGLVSLVRLSVSEACTQSTCPNFLLFNIDDMWVPDSWDLFKPDTEADGGISYDSVDTTYLDKIKDEGLLFSVSFSNLRVLVVCYIYVRLEQSANT